MEEEKRYELEEFVQELGKYKGRHTELISVYAPAGYNLINVAKQLDQEKSTAMNIKSKNNRKNVLDALERLTRHIGLIKKAPENGIALFAGNISETEGQPQIEVWSIEPPMPLKTRLYRCDKEFVLEPLREMLEATEVYGLVVIDRQEATIGLLEGKQISVLQHLDSYVPGKTEKGGQCLSPDTLVMKDNGEIIELKEGHNPLILASENLNTERSELTLVIEKWENEKPLFKIKTKNPVFEIDASQDHIFFVRTEEGIEEKPLTNIKKGDYLLLPSKIDLNLKEQPIEFNLNLSGKHKQASIPITLDKDLARIFGYYLGDGCFEEKENRITFFEQREEVARHYNELIKKTFGLSCVLKFRESKNYYQIRIYSKLISQFFKNYFPQKNKTLEGEIPLIVLKSPDDILASFIGGFFDAEGYVSSSRIGLGINNKKIAKQIQMVLLRLGLLSSLLEYDNRKNLYSKKMRYTIEVSGIDSMKIFMEQIGFISSEKNLKLKQIIEKRGNQDHINQLVANGKEVARIIKKSKESLMKYACSMFFSNKRQMSRQVFKRKILDKTENPELKRRLEFFYNSNLTIAKINKIISLKVEKTIDIETKNHNFIANGFLVHNSAARYARIRDGMAKEFFRKVADAVKNNFWELKKLKGIIVGGPGPTKEDFLKEGQIVTALKEKILGVKDIGDANRQALESLVEVSQDLLAEQEITREKKILEDFFNKLGKQPEKTAYGLEKVNKALTAGAVGTLILSKKLGRKLIYELEEKARNISSKIEIVSEETEEGQQFKNLGGVGAILRYEI